MSAETHSARCRRHFRSESYQDMLALIAVLSKVQVMLDGVRFVGRELDGHVKLTPTFFLDTEGGLFEDCS